MEYDQPKFCPAIWFSGFLAFGAVMHLLRLLWQASVVINGHAIPLTVSAILAGVLGMLSITFAVMGINKPCEHKDENSASCKA